MEFKQHYLENTRFEFQRLKGLAERAMEQIPSADGFHFELDEASNSIAVLIQHLSGNMVSRWTDFLTSDGEKPNRHRDAEFGSNRERTVEELMEIWERGWASLFNSLGALVAEDVDKTVAIRREDHTVLEAVQRQIVHASYHIGQLVYVARHVSAEGWRSLSIGKGQSQGAPGRYKKL
ncbi:MAG: DUF1572 domain-containing protein [Acidobacteriota bacterium]|nr:MAG: DUF1572 domain-containing protein [Acidobacteriota bacterium]